MLAWDRATCSAAVMLLVTNGSPLLTTCAASMPAANTVTAKTNIRAVDGPILPFKLAATCRSQPSYLVGLGAITYERLLALGMPYTMLSVWKLSNSRASGSDRSAATESSSVACGHAEQLGRALRRLKSSRPVK